MKSASILGDWRLGVALWLIGAIVAFFAASGIGALMFSFGVVSTAIHFVAMWKVIGAASKFMTQPESKRRNFFFSIGITLALTATLPVLIAAGLYAKSLGSVALTCFLWGLGLVYFALVGWAISKR